MKDLLKKTEAEQKMAELPGLFSQGSYQEIWKSLDRINTVEDAEQLSEKGIRPVLHNGKVTGWEVEAMHGQA